MVLRLMLRWEIVPFLLKKKKKNRKLCLNSLDALMLKAKQEERELPQEI